MADIGTKEFAEKYGVDVITVRRWCRDGKIKGVTQDSKGSPYHIPKEAKLPEFYLKRIKK